MSRGRRLAVALLAALPLLAVAALAGAATWSCRAAPVGLEDGRLRPCPSTPNCVCSEGLDPSIEPLDFAGDPDAALRSLVDFIAEQPRATIETSADGYVHAVFRSALFRFRDDVELRLDREAGVIHVRSASRVGYSDLGANRARIESIRAEWEPPSPEASGANPRSESHGDS